ncbi:MAG: hypothetical protein FJ134_01275 [Deltaproteobacteria bacterium]|nr:hypothetical protein [Deltaproteobacteria bacterium]
MQLPIPPTDNLYKFLALSGLVLVIFSIVFPLSRISDINLKLLEFEMQSDVLEVELKYLEQDTAEWVEKENPTPEEQEMLRKRTLELRIKHTELKGRIRQINGLINEVKENWKILKVGGTVGMAFSFIGFGLWLFRIQLPSDLLLQKQVKNFKTSSDEQGKS